MSFTSSLRPALTAAILLSLVPSLSTANPPRPKADFGHLPGLFADGSYATPEEVVAEMKALAHPWNHLFMAPPPAAGGALPEGYEWEHAVLADDPQFAVVAGSLSGHYLHVGNHVAVLLQRGEDRKWKVADLIVRRLGGYSSFKASLIRPLSTESPSLLLRTYEGGRRQGESLHEIFRPVLVDDHFLQWQPTLAIPTEYNQAGVTEELEFFTDGEGTLQVKVTSEWISADRQPEVASYTLSWDPVTRSFPLFPLRGKLALLAELPVLPAIPADVPEGTEPDIMDAGRIANLKIGSTEAEVKKEIESKLFKGEDIVYEAIGEAVQEWIYPEAGISLDMISEKRGGEKTVFSITLKAPSKALTGRGIGIGSAKADVQRVYSDYKSEGDEGFFGEEDVHLVGSIYGGMIFTFKDGKVSEIFLGAAAE